MSGECDVLVVGGGLAAMSAALTSARLGRSTSILTGGVPGGELLSIEKIEGVPGFPDGIPGYDLCPITQEQADAVGVLFLSATGDSIVANGDRWRVTSAEGDLDARAVIIATGTAVAKLGVPGEERLFGKGVSHCASCDGPLLRNRIAVVVGGGDSAMQEALTLADHLSRVVLLERGDALTGQETYRERILSNPKIEPQFGKVVTEIVGDDGVTHVRVRDVASGSESEIETAAVFAFPGLVPNSDLVRDLLPLDETGRIRVDPALRTPARGICAAGNVRQASPHRAAAAMGDGAAAAVAADLYLATGEWPLPS
jgi:thioredoxin reductase (NADPH)